eukprot:5430633-Amphidinium_carterae.1
MTDEEGMKQRLKRRLLELLRQCFLNCFNAPPAASFSAPVDKRTATFMSCLTLRLVYCAGRKQEQLPGAPLDSV